MRRPRRALDAVSRGILAELTPQLQNASWNRDELEAIRGRNRAEAHGLGLGKLAGPLRAALAGRTVTPSVFDMMLVLGRDETVARLDEAAAQGSARARPHPTDPSPLTRPAPGDLTKGMTMPDTTKTATLSFGNKIDRAADAARPTLGPDVIDIRKLYAEADVFTYDPGFTSTAACALDDHLYRRRQGRAACTAAIRSSSWPKSPSYIEVCYLLLYGELPTADQLADFTTSRDPSHDGA